MTEHEGTPWWEGVDAILWGGRRSTRLSPPPWPQRAAGSLCASVLRCHPGPASSTNSSPDSPPFLGRGGCHGNPEVGLLAQRQPGIVVFSVAHNMAPLGHCAPKAFIRVPIDSSPPSKCSGSQSHQGLPFPHFIASAGAVSVFVRVGLRHLPAPGCGRGVPARWPRPQARPRPSPCSCVCGEAPSHRSQIREWVHPCGRGQTHGCGTGCGHHSGCGHKTGRGHHPGWPGAPPGAGETRVVTSGRDTLLPPWPQTPEGGQRGHPMLLSPHSWTPHPALTPAHLPGQGLPQQLGGLGVLQQADAPHDRAQGDAGAPGGPQQTPTGCLLLGGLRGRQRGGQRGQATYVPHGVLFGVRRLLGRPGLPQAAVPAATDLSISTRPRPLLGATPTWQGGVPLGSSPTKFPTPFQVGHGPRSPTHSLQRGLVPTGPTLLSIGVWLCQTHPCVPTHLSPPTWRSGCPGRSRAGA